MCWCVWLSWAVVSRDGVWRPARPAEWPPLRLPYPIRVRLRLLIRMWPWLLPADGGHPRRTLRVNTGGRWHAGHGVGPDTHALRRWVPLSAPVDVIGGEMVGQGGDLSLRIVFCRRHVIGFSLFTRYHNWTIWPTDGTTDGRTILVNIYVRHKDWKDLL